MPIIRSRYVNPRALARELYERKAIMGKNTVEAPDYAPLAEASAEAARIQAGLGREQLQFAREQYDRTAPILQSIADQQMAAQAEQMQQARDYYDYQTSTYRPLERSIVQDAQRFNTEAYREQLASQLQLMQDGPLVYHNNKIKELWHQWVSILTVVGLQECKMQQDYNKQRCAR